MRSTVRHAILCWKIVGVCFIASVIASFENAAFAADQRTSDGLAAAERLVDEAAKAAQEGNAGRKFSLLRQASAIAPDLELAPGSLGKFGLTASGLPSKKPSVVLRPTRLRLAIVNFGHVSRRRSKTNSRLPVGAAKTIWRRKRELIGPACLP